MDFCPHHQRTAWLIISHRTLLISRMYTIVCMLNMPLSKVSGSLLPNAYLSEFMLLHIARQLRQEHIPSLSGQLVSDLLGENSSKLTAGKSVSLFPFMERSLFPFLCIGNFLATFPCQWPSKSLQSPYALQRSKHLPSAPHQERFADLWY